MKLFERQEIAKKPLPGRVLQLVVGEKDAASPSSVMTMGFARYSAESGPMSPHRHAEEIVYILSSQDGYTRYGGCGDEPNELGVRVVLKPGMILHFPAKEWHVFDFDEGGHVDIIFFYSQADVYSKT